MDRRAEIALSIAESAMNVMNAAMQLPDNKKRILKPRNRRPMKKRKRAQAVAKMCIEAYMGASVVNSIMWQPSPSYPTGGNFVREYGPEIILRNHNHN